MPSEWLRETVDLSRPLRVSSRDQGLIVREQKPHTACALRTKRPYRFFLTPALCVSRERRLTLARSFGEAESQSCAKKDRS